MKTIMGYSIWIKPHRKIKKKLANLMLRLSKRFNASRFTTPHITLYEDLKGNREDLIQKTYILSRSITPFKVKLTKIDDGKNFNNLVILVKKTNELIRAYKKAGMIFKIKPKKKEYIPHLTLLLKDITDKQRKEIAKEIGRNFNMEFEVKSLYLVPIGKDPKKWIPIKRFNLKK